VFPQLLGEAYRQAPHFQALRLPILIITSEFGTVSMWDWEIRRYLRSLGVETIAPFNLEGARAVCRALGLRRQLRGSKLLVFQDNPGAGFQASIFKRFYWWEEECSRRMAEKFGVAVVKRSFRELGARAKMIPDRAAREAWQSWRPQANHSFGAQYIPAQALTRSITVSPEGGENTRPLLAAVKIYLAVKEAMEEEGNVLAAGINCLNESHFSDTTPCLAWAMLYEEQDLLWGCEADTLSMLTEILLHRSLGVPLMMTNLYPFLMGKAATEHEHIPGFPAVEQPENCILTAHCGYLGVAPPSFSTGWSLRPKVLAIVDENATAIDARLPAGPVTLAKLDPTLETLTTVPGVLESYVQYPGSHCLNGGLIRVPDGRRLLENLPSHHSIILIGHHPDEIDLVGKVFGLHQEEIV
jgi:L-fucose isomerase-like protein